MTDHTEIELAVANVSGADPQWDTSGEWLIFRTSGTGEWENEGIYARDPKNGAIGRLVQVVPRSITVAGDTLFVTRSPSAGAPRGEVMVFSLAALLKQDTPATRGTSARTRHHKE